LIGCSKSEKQNNAISYSFQDNTQDWTGYFSGNFALTSLPENDSSLEFSNAAIPIANKKTKGLLLRADNYSNNIFMYVVKKIDSLNLKPNTTYNVNLTFDLATSIPSNLLEYGGTPGQTIYMKAAVLSTAPNITTYPNHPLIGNLSNEFINNLENIGNIAKSDSSKDMSFEIKNFQYKATVTTDNDGCFWTLIGIDSQFEIPLELYISNIQIEAN
jgi:hypothetical protein